MDISLEVDGRSQGLAAEQVELMPPTELADPWSQGSQADKADLVRQFQEGRHSTLVCFRMKRPQRCGQRALALGCAENSQMCIRDRCS